MRNWYRALLSTGLLLACGGTIALVHAQSGSASRVLHEDIEVPKAEAQRTAARIEKGQPVIGPEPKAQQNPTAIASQDKLLPKPSAAPSPVGQEPVHGRKEFGVDRQTESTLDYSTEADTTLRYIGVFNPSIVPFKRMSAMDSVRSDYTLFSSQSALSDLPVGGEASPNHDLFWGSIVVDLVPGEDIPIASVAPDMRILSYETTPTVELSFSKDLSDNYFLRTEESGKRGVYRVVFLAQASPTYFAPSIPKNLKIRDIPRGHISAIPDNVQKVADRVLDELRLHPGMQVSDALKKLVYYFRSFDAKTPPPRSGDIYYDLYKSQAGVCRHRSFAFMITANALGIPTRYVTNEAHAWVEIWLPTSDWLRIDLGGAASTLDIQNASDKSIYRPRSADPFAKPESYNENYSQLSGDVRGLRPEQIAERQEVYETDDAENGNGSFFGVDDPHQPENIGPDEPLTGPGSGLPSVPDEELAGKTPTQSRVLTATEVGYRGDSIEVSGVIEDESGKALGGLRVDVFLAPAGNEGNDSLLVGRSVTDSEGLVTTEFELPLDLGTQLYEVFISTPGNEKYQPSVSF